MAVVSLHEACRPAVLTPRPRHRGRIGESTGIPAPSSWGEGCRRWAGRGQLARAFERQRRVLVEAFPQVDSWGFMRSRPQPPSPWLPNLEISSAAGIRIGEPFVDNPGNTHALKGNDTFEISTSTGGVWQVKVASSSGPYQLTAGDDRAKYWSPFPGARVLPAGHHGERRPGGILQDQVCRQSDDVTLCTPARSRISWSGRGSTERTRSKSRQKRALFRR
jgi:hypothetical protein